MENKEIADLIASNAAYRNIVERTSVRRYTTEDISPELKDALCYAAMSAPSGVNRQPWELVVIDDRSLLDQLAKALPYAKMAAQAPMAILVCGNKERFLEGDDSTLWEQDLSAASENILLAAHALGLGGVWTCLYPHEDRMDSVRRVLHLPDEYIPFNLIPVGHPLTQQKPMDKWHQERVHHNGF